MEQIREAVRRVDWRFLLDDAELRAVAPLGVSDDGPLFDGFLQVGATVVDAGAVGEEGVGVVFARDPGDEAISRAVGLRGEHGSIVIETTSRRARSELRGRLRLAGLRVQQYGCWPTCSGATRFVPLDDRSELIASARAAKNRNRRAVGTLLSWLGLGKLVFRQATSVATAADRPYAPAPLRVALAKGTHAGGTMTLLTPRFGSSRHVIAMITAEQGRSLVAKTPRLPGDDEQLSLEARGLTSISGPDPVRPELVADTERFGQRWLVQTRIPGVPLSRRDVARHPDRWIAAAQDWLQGMPSEGSSRPDDDGRSERLIRPALDVITAASNGERELRALVADAERAFELVGATPLPIVAEHGDFRPPNLVMTGSRAIGAVDWELAERSGLPLYDLLFFHAYVAEVLPSLRPTLRRAAADVLESQGLDPELLGPLSTVASLRQLANAVVRGTVSLASPAPQIAHSDVGRAWFVSLQDQQEAAS